MALTYDQLFDALRREKSRDELQALEHEFYAAAHALLSSKEAEARQARALSADGQRAGIEYQNCRRILRELYDRRERKIVTLALHKTRADAALIDTEALLPEEHAFFNRLVQLLIENRVLFLHAEEEAPKPAAREKPAALKAEPTVERRTHEGMTVRFLASVPKFVGKDLNVFGPFDEGTTATLPEDVAAILIKKGRARQDA